LYLQYFGLNEAPFSITPDPAFVYLSEAHREALTHLMYGVGQGGAGGFVQLTGEVGTGKTTLCRCLLEQVPDDCQVALVLNPLMTPRELLATVCEELGIDTAGLGDSNKALVDALNAYLLEQHGAGRRVVIIIDEAQNLSPEALEQVRLLTNLETAKHKLLQMVLLGQPELRRLLQRQDLRQLAQRITARYHLVPLSQEDTRAYVMHRMQVAGSPRNPFRKSALRALYRRSGGVPRLINIIADRALAAAYAREAGYVSAQMVSVAANEVQPSEGRVRTSRWPVVGTLLAATLLLLVVVLTVGPPEWRWQPAGGELAKASAAAPPVVAADSTVPSETGRGGSAAAENDDRPAPGVMPAAGPATNEAAVQEAEIQGDPRPPVGGMAELPDPAPPLLAELDVAWLDEQHRAAWQGVAELWRDGGRARAIQAACDGALRTGYACIREQGNWSRIRQLGLPVVLVLREETTRLLVLRGFAGGALLVGEDETAMPVSRDAIEQRWLGEYFVVWPQAPDWPAEIRRGESGAAVDIVMKMAAFAEPAWSGSGIFDEQFEAWLMSFQRRNGLRADGIIGPRTLMHLVAPTIAHPRLVVETREGP
jgi:general secretion pathway protein A